MPTFSLSDIEDRVYALLDGNTGFYPEAQVRSAINEGLFRLNILTGYQQAVVPFANFTQADQLIYSVPTGILIPLSLYCEGVELEKTSLNKLASAYRTWATDTTANRGPVGRWAPIDMRKFVLHPADHAGGQALEMSGIAPVTPLSAAGYTVSLEDAHVSTLVNFARVRVSYKEGGQPWALASANAWKQMIRDLGSLVIWVGFKFPRYWLLKQEEPAAARGL